MMTEAVRNRLILFLLLVAGCFLRFRHLGFQSFWLDELHTAIEADPSASWAELWSALKCCDQHPPVFFFLSKLFFYLFGSSEAVARSVSAIAGTTGIWAMYLLGKQLYSARVGLIAAALTCFNYFHIWYSQEARPYALAFLFATLSFVFLVRLIKMPTRKNSLLYALFTLLMMGSHYFGLFVFMSQLVTGLVFWFLEKENKKKLFLHFLLSGIVIGLIYALWLPFLLSMSAIKSFWIQPIPPSFAIDFFNEYFGNSDLLRPFALLFLLACLFHVFTKTESDKTDEQKKLVTTFLVCLIWITVSYFIPYLRSLLVVPMLYPRYTIVLLPAFLILLSLGPGLIVNKLVSRALLIVFVLLSLTDLFLVKDYYKKVSKSQFRELGQFIASDPSATYPVLADVTSWHQRYYLKRYGYKGVILPGNTAAHIDSFVRLARSERPPAGFWLSDGHTVPEPPAELIKRIGETYVLARSASFNGTWARLYLNPRAGAYFTLDHHFFRPDQKFVSNGDTVVAIWEKEAVSQPVALKKGNYKISLLMSGSPATGVYPHIDVQVNGRAIGQCELSGTFTSYTFDLEATSDMQAEIRIIMTNDAMDPATREDRNAFVRSVLFIQSM